VIIGHPEDWELTEESKDSEDVGKISRPEPLLPSLSSVRNSGQTNWKDFLA
jgi:hypothetical protein